MILTYTSHAGGETPDAPRFAPWDKGIGDLSSSSPCSGVSLTPASDLQAAINARPNGTTFCLQPGIYYLTKSIQTRSYDRFIGQAGVIFDGQGKVDKGLWGYGGDAGEVHVTVKNIVFQHFTVAAVRLGWYSYVAHNEMRDNQIGAWVNSHSALDANYIHDNSQYGITGGPGKDILIENNELAHNNTSHDCGGTCIGNAGGSKIVGSTTGTQNLTWRNNYVHDNIGVGIWSDGNVSSSLYEYNRVTNNSGSGIEHEISWDAVVRYNTLTNNDSRHAGRSCGYGGQLIIANSTNVEAHGNTVTGSNGTNGICAIDIHRPDVPAPHSQAVANYYVHDNDIFMTDGASTGLVGRASSLTANNRFVNNSYHVTDTTRRYWAWPGVSATWAAWQALGRDTTGSLSRWP